MDYRKLLSFGIVKTLGPDEVIFHEGDPGDEMYIILSGHVEVFMTSIEGYNIPVARLGPGDFFGEMSLLEGLHRSASVLAFEETRVMVVNKENFEKVIYHEPQLAYRIMKGLSGRLRKQNEKIRQLMEGVKPSQGAEGSMDEDYIASLAGLISVPEGHKQYSVVAPGDHKKFLFSKEVQCPVCQRSFEADMVRSTKLILQNIDPDFRQRYTGFEPLWYMIWVCPHCYYANFNYQFTQVPAERKNHLHETCMKLKEKVYFAYTSPRDIDQVFVAYYLTLNCITVIRPNAEQLGRIWLRLSWLYEDVKDYEMYRLATGKALGYFSKLLNYGSSISKNSEQGQRLFLLLGELHLKNGELTKALEYFRQAVMHYKGNRTLNKKANDRILELKKNAVGD